MMQSHGTDSRDGRAANFIDMAGLRIGKWDVISYVAPIKWRCRCECGRISDVGGPELRSGRSSGCKSCALVGHAFKHGNASDRLGFSPKYRAWLRMIGRVRDKSSPRARWYSDVKIDSAWAVDFSAFYRDVSDPKLPGLTLDRIDNALGYVPGNVRWATMQEQARNRRSNRMIKIDGRVQCLAAWADETGIKPTTIMYRIKVGNPVFGAFLGQIMLPNGQTVLERISATDMLPALAAPTHK